MSLKRKRMLAHRMPVIPNMGRMPRMTVSEFNAALDTLGLTQVSFSRLLDYNDRTVRMWVAGKLNIPRVVAVLLRLMLARRIKPLRLAEIAGITWPDRR